MISKRLILVGAFVVGFSSPTWSACEPPAKPTIPDPETAVTPLMIKAKNEVTAFMDAANAYLECKLSDSEHNAMVDEMNEVANAFNACIKAYKKRMSG